MRRVDIIAPRAAATRVLRAIHRAGVVHIAAFCCDLCTHLLNVLVREGKGLQVGQAPVHLAEAWREADASAVGRDALRLAPGGLERMAQAHPRLGLVRVFRQHGCVELDGLIEFTDPDEGGRLEIAITRVARVNGQHAVDFGKRCRGLALAMQHDRVVVPRRGEAGREFEAAREQGLRVAIPAEAGHLLINTGKKWLITLDDSPVNFDEKKAASFPGHADYEPFKKLRGAAYYIVEKNGKPYFIKNPRYKSAPPAEELYA